MHNCSNAPLMPGDRWHLSVLPTLVLARSANDAGASTAAQSGRTKSTAQLVLRTQARRKEKGHPYIYGFSFFNQDSGTSTEADKSAVGAINRPLRLPGSFC